MSKDDLKAAVSQRKAPPPLTRGKGVQLSVDQEQNSKTATQQNSEIAEKQDSDNANQRISEIANKRDSTTAVQQESVSAIKQDSELANQQDSINAEVQSSDSAKERTSEAAKLQKNEVKRINRGVTLPEDLFREYKVSAAILDVSMHKLMEEILQDGLNKVRRRVAKRTQ